MNEILSRARFLEINEYPRDYRDCVKQAIDELVVPDEMRDLYNIFGINHDEYIENMCEYYLRYKSQLVSEQWQKSLIK